MFMFSTKEVLATGGFHEQIHSRKDYKLKPAGIAQTFRRSARRGAHHEPALQEDGTLARAGLFLKTA